MANKVLFTTSFGGYSRHYIRNLYGQPLYKGLFIDACFDVGRIENVHFWPFWTAADEGSPVREFTLKQGEAFIFARTDWEYVTNCFAIGYHVGFRFIASTHPTLGPRSAVRGTATTGSGRKLVGALIGADLVVNEITAHVAGAVRVDPGDRTIFEIGGQDAKYMSVRDGDIVDANMNYVCAAGTGSFVEEQAAKLGFAIDEVGEAALGTAPPYTSNRCTVFMEQDVLELLNQGATRREAAGAVMYSVIDN